MNDTVQKVDDILTKYLHVEDAVVSMRGVAILMEEFLNGNSFAGIKSPDGFIENRISDIMDFTIRTLTASADNLSRKQEEFENELIATLDTIDEE